MSSGCLGNFTIRTRLNRVDEIRESDGILDEEHWNIVAHNVKVAFVGVANLDISKPSL